MIAGGAGDIGYPNKENYRAYLLEQADRFEHVLVVAGNHEYYNQESVQHADRLIVPPPLSLSLACRTSSHHSLPAPRRTTGRDLRGAGQSALPQQAQRSRGRRALPRLHPLGTVSLACSPRVLQSLWTNHTFLPLSYYRQPYIPPESIEKVWMRCNDYKIVVEGKALEHETTSSGFVSLMSQVYKNVTEAVKSGPPAAKSEDEARKNESENAEAAEKEYHQLTPHETNLWHEQHVDWLVQEIERVKEANERIAGVGGEEKVKVVVLTHHAPSKFRCIHPEAAGIEEICYDDLEWMMEDPVVRVVPCVVCRSSLLTHTTRANNCWCGATRWCGALGTRTGRVTTSSTRRAWSPTSAVTSLWPLTARAPTTSTRPWSSTSAVRYTSSVCRFSASSSNHL